MAASPVVLLRKSLLWLATKLLTEPHLTVSPAHGGTLSYVFTCLNTSDIYNFNIAFEL
jgi:hypothetical protein